MLSTGLHLGWAAPAIYVLTKTTRGPLQLEVSESSLLASSSLLGAFVGAIGAYLLANFWSQSKCLLLASIPHGTAFLIFATWPNLYAFYFARFIAGLGNAIGFGVATMYAVEIASTRIRGTIGILMMIAFNLGIFLVYTLLPFVPFKHAHLLFLGVSILQFTLCLFLPESPYLLLKQGDSEGAKNVLIKLRNTTKVDKEFHDMYDYVQTQYSEPVTLQSLISEKIYLRALIFTSGVVLAQQCSGASSLEAYSQVIFDSGKSFISADVCGILYSFSGLAFPFICGIAVDNVGRKILFVASGLIISVALSVLGFYYYLLGVGYAGIENLAFLPLTTMLGYSLGYGIGLGALPLLYMSELMPTKVRALGTCIMTLVGNATGILMTMTYTSMQKKFGSFAPLWMYAILTACNCVLMMVFLPETKGKSFDQIQRMLEKSKKDDNKDISLEKVVNYK